MAEAAHANAAVATVTSDTSPAAAVAATSAGAFVKTEDDGESPKQVRRRFVVDGRVRSGCLTCKARKKKCDGDNSSVDGRCKSCIRLGLVCEQAPLRKVVAQPPRQRKKQQAASEHTESSTSPDIRSQDAAATTPSGSPTAIISAMSASSEGMQRLLLRYFLDQVAPLCSILQQDGPSFCSVLLPMAFVDSSLLHALFAYASAHCQDDNTPTISVSSEARLEFENQVVRGVSEAIMRNAVTETTVACSLIISTAEVIRGDTSRWQLHLEGAGHLVNHLGASKLLETPDGAFILRYFAYHDIISALSTQRRTLVEGVYWVEDGEDVKVTEADSFMGLAHHIIKHISDICGFIADTGDLSPLSPTDIRSRETVRAEDMAQTLRSQDLHIHVAQTDAHIAALVHHAEAMRFGALFHLYRHLLRFCDAGAVYRLRMADCVARIIEHVSKIPAQLYCEMGVLCPLFMAGIGGSDNEETRVYIANRLSSIEAWTKFKHVARARELLQKLWQQGRTDWEVMLKELDWHISLA